MAASTAILGPFLPFAVSLQTLRGPIFDLQLIAASFLWTAAVHIPRYQLIHDAASSTVPICCVYRFTRSSRVLRASKSCDESTKGEYL
jgi:hypothetical protein